MIKIVGILVVFGCVFGGFVLSGGKLMALVHPFEVMIIGGAALGAFLQANPGSAFMTVFKKSLKMFSSRFTHAFYLEVLKLLYEILNKSRREGMMAIEADVEDPNASPIFSKYPGILKDAQMTAFICDYLRIMSSGNMAPHELENLFDMEISSLKEELEHPAHAVAKVADGMPAMGIVAAVLGIVITMSILATADNAQIGEKVGRHWSVPSSAFWRPMASSARWPGRWSTMPRKRSTCTRRSRPRWWPPLPACRRRWPSSSGARCCSRRIDRASASSNRPCVATEAGC